jgi:hypothetical protein
MSYIKSFRYVFRVYMFTCMHADVKHDSTCTLTFIHEKLLKYTLAYVHACSLHALRKE